MIFWIMMIIIFQCYVWLCAGKYVILTDLTMKSTASIWYDGNTNQIVDLCTRSTGENLAGVSVNSIPIYWKRFFSINPSTRVYVYLEYSVSGQWNQDELQIYANGLKVLSKKITLNDNNKYCTSRFIYESNARFLLNQYADSLKIEIKVNTINIGLYIKNVVIVQRTENALLKPVNLLNFIPTCSAGFLFNQYYCDCTPQVFEISECQQQCSQNFIYDATMNECYLINHCSSCQGINTVISCDIGYYEMEGSDIQSTSCVEKCPNDKFQDENTKECIDLQQHLIEVENQGNPVDHFFFFKNIPDFMHFYQHQTINLEINSIPQKNNDREFYYQDGLFLIGTFDYFQTQTLQLSIKVKVSQYQIRFRAIGHFIDFYPLQNDIYINGIKMSASIIQISQKNIQKQDQDYLVYYDYYWTRPRSDIYIRNQNQIILNISQPLQNGIYQGYFYLEDIQIYQFECLPGCNSCFTISYCTPCLNPANKNPDDCTCISGYMMKDDVCIACPTYCSSCSAAGVCDSCKASTMRINSPQCDKCPDQYFIKIGQENCQICQIGCNICTSETQCNQCLAGYYRDINNLCVQQCQDGYFNDISNVNDYKCTICDNNCLNCQNTSTQCTACSQTSTLVNQHCYQCNQGSYLDGITCVPCITGCQICKSINCQTCQDSYYYQASINQCVGNCDINQYGNTLTKSCELCDSTCLTCSGGTYNDCLSCYSENLLNLLNTVSGFCSPNCKIGFYKVNSYCAKCWKGCTSCIDSTQACLICAQNYYRFTDTGLCYEICPNGYYNNKQGYVCSICNSTCKTCSGRLDTNCLTCSSPLAYYQNKCLSICPDGYGNINNICQTCTANCKTCFGTAINECAICNTGFYYLRGQCYIKCPTFFIGVRPQYVCKCIYENCVACTSSQFFYQNKCFDQCPTGTYGFNGLCVTCDISCLTCFGENYDECLTCSKINGLILYQNKCVTECFGYTYEDILNNECKSCDQSCYACNGPQNTDCTDCVEQKLLSAEGSCLDSCPEGQYLVLSESKCYKCDPSCLTCFGNTNQSCLSCINYLYLNQCVNTCPDGFTLSNNNIECQPDKEIVITQCSYQCQNCQFTARFCTQCNTLRYSNPPNCDCIQGYYDDEINGCIKCDNKCFTCNGNSKKCLKCKGDRQLPNCECPLFYYDDGLSVNCIKCQENCSTCNNNINCLTCLTNRINPPNCICPDGFYEAYTLFCKQCSQKCETCNGSDQFCQTCSEIRINPPICSCPQGYFSNSDEICQQCDQTCIDCDFTGCLSCFGNRVGPTQGKCQCDQQGVSRIMIGSLYCTDCQIGVPYFALNQDFTGFNINFGSQVKLLLGEIEKGNNICNYLFDEVSLIKLGNNPQCDEEFNVLFGLNPNIKVDDTLQLKLVYKLEGCIEKFSNILSMPLKIPTFIDLNSHKPQIQFNQLDNPNVCTPISFYFDQKLFNGNQKFEIISWNMILPSTIEQNIINILEANTLNNSEAITFPPKTFQPNQLYKFQVFLRSFAKLENIITIEFVTIQKSTIVFGPVKKNNQFNRFQTISIQSIINYYNCLEIDDPPQQTLFYQISLINNKQQLINGTIQNGLRDGYSIEIPLNFNPYYFNFTNPYTLLYETILIKNDQIDKTNSTFDLFIIASIPIIQIIGGNRMVGYTDDLYLNTTINDLDLNPNEENNNTIYDCFWSCHDIINETACIDTNLKIIEFNNNCNQIIKSKTFNPYQVFNFQVSIIKQKQTYSNKVSIQIIEIDLPILTINGVDQNIIHNYYDEFIYQMQYSGINPDLLMYAGALIYDQVIQSTFEFYYLDFKFKLQNFFTNLTTSIGNIIKLRLSIYDPRFIMPSLNTQTLKMNIPPLNCQMVIKSQQPYIEFLDQIQLQISGCIDEDLPLFYDVWLYSNETIYQSDIVASIFQNFIILSQDSSSNNFNLTVPYLNDEHSIIIVIIKDSQMGRTNLTNKIKIKEYISIDQNTFIEYQKQFHDFDYQLFGYGIITERLIRTNQFQEYKEVFLREMIMIDQNQTLLSNQTDSLYHSISNLLNYNSSLLKIHQDTLLHQLNFRIPIAYKQLVTYNRLQISNYLTSGQNIDKANFIKQYYTFSNILSSYLNYRVSNNISSINISSQLQQMQVQLQEVSIPNEPLYKVQAQSVNLNFGFVTQKIASTLSGSQLSTSKGRILEDEQNNSSQYNTTTSFYKYSMTRYIDNPFYQTDKFPKNSSGYQAIDPKIQLNTTSNNMNANLNFKFPVTKQLESNTSLKCITQVQSGEWNANICGTENQTGQVICKCESLNPTSVMESLDYILDKAEEVFSIDTFLAFGSFPFYKTIIFYFYLFITGIYLSVVYWGVKADNIMFTQIHLQQELTEQKQKEEEQKLKELAEKQILDSETFQNKDKDLIKISTINTPDSERVADQLQPTAPQKVNKNTAKLPPLEKSRYVTIGDLEQKQINQDKVNGSYSSQPKEDILHKSGEQFVGEQNVYIKQQEDNANPKPSGLKQMMLNKSISKLKAYIQYLKFFHQLLSIIYKSDQKKPRGLRASIVYTSVVGSLAVLFVFNQPNNLSFTVSLTLLTLPINKIYQIILEKLLSHKKKVVRTIGAIFMIFSAGIISYIMLSGLVMMDSAEKANQWSAIFLGQFFGDNIFYSPLTLVFQYVVHMEFIKSPLCTKLLDKILDEKAKEFLYGLMDDLNEEN